MPIPFTTADTLLQSIGINTHMNYAAYQNADLVADLIKGLHIKNVRDGLHYWGNNDALNILYSSLVNLGTNFCYVVDQAENLGPITQAMLDEYDWLSARRIKYFEGPNEKDSTAATDPNWVANTRAYQTQLASCCRPMAAGLSVHLIAPSLAYTGNAQALGDLTPVCDLGNLHAYPGSNLPESFLGSLLKQVQAVSGSKRAVVTEFGYPTTFVSELAQRKLLPRTFFSYFLAGAFEMYSYELLDQEPVNIFTDEQLHLGIVHSDGTPKPAYTTLANMFALMDTGQHPAFSNPNYTLSNSAVYSLLLQSREREWLLFLWQPVPVYNFAAKIDIANPNASVTMNLGVASTVEVFDPSQSMVPIQAYRYGSPASIAISVPDYPIAVRIYQ